MLIFFRACETNLSPGSLAGTQKRWLDYTKPEIIKKCWISLQKELTSDDITYLVCDNVTDETKQWFSDNANSDIIIKDIPALAEYDHPYKDYHYTAINHCIDFFEYFISTIEVLNEDLIYICEDDYLHKPGWREVLDKLYSTGYEGFYLPYDYPDRYTLDRSKACELFNIKGTHYRTVPSSTLTMVAKAKVFKHYTIDLQRAGVFAEDSWTWKVFKQNMCLCPIPSTTTHLQNNCISPGVDWEQIWNMT